jgi:hypothetical protein
MKPYAFLSILVVSVLLLTFCLTAPVQASSTWAIQTLDTNTPDLNGYCPIVLDSNGTPHIAYTSNDLGGVVYASWNDSNWNAEKVTAGTVLDLALDSSNNPHILYDGGINGLMYASRSGSNWTTQTVDKNGGSKPGSLTFGSLALDSSGNPHIAYTESDQVEYASWTGTTWGIQTVDTAKAPFRVSLAIDSNNTAYLMYGLTDEVKLAVYNNSVWNIQVVASNMDSLGNLVLDSKGYPHLIYSRDYTDYTKSEPLNITIMYARWNGAAWNTQQVVSNVSAGGVGATTGIYTMACLSLDAHDNPHIAYVTSYPEGAYQWGNLAYASWTGKTWGIQTVNSTVIAGSCYLALDSNGNPHISLVGVVQGSRAEELTGAYSYIAPVMYATTIEPTSSSSSPVFSNTQLVIIGVLVAAIVVVTLVALMLKKKLKFRGE